MRQRITPKETFERRVSIKCGVHIHYELASPQSLSIHLTSTKGPIDVLLCPDDDNDPKSPVKNGGTDINGNSPFLKVLQGPPLHVNRKEFPPGYVLALAEEQ